MAKQVSAKTLEARRREAEAFRLRAAGVNYIDIARELGYASPSGAQAAFVRYIKRLGAGDEPAVAKTLALQRLERLLRALWPAATTGQLGAVRDAIRVIREEALILGIYPERRPAEAPDLSDLMEIPDLSIDEWTRAVDFADFLRKLPAEDQAFFEQLGDDLPRLASAGEAGGLEPEA